MGDDSNNLDDEDGVRLLTPLGPGASATFEVTATNTTGSNAYLQGFLDFNRDGIFGLGEQFASNIPVVAGSLSSTQLVTVNVPEGVDPGSTYVRFRLSQTSGIGATGFAETGEVEDHQVHGVGAGGCGDCRILGNWLGSKRSRRKVAYRSVVACPRGPVAVFAR